MNRLSELMVKQGENNEISIVVDYAVSVARYYECVLALGSITLNQPDDYLEKYGNEYYLID